MAGGVNKVILIGHLGSDPEVRYTASGSPVANFSIATTENWTDKQGQRQERTEWHRIVVWNKQAELCREYLSKGRQVYIEGRLQTRQWDDRDGNKRYTTEIVAQQVRFLGSRGDAAASSAPREAGGMDSFAAPSPSPSPGHDATPDFGPTPMDDDVPF